MQVESEVKTIKVDYTCPKCGNGYLRPTGQCFPMNPLMYPHKCTSCDYTEAFEKTYPYIDYVTKYSLMM